MEEQFIKMNESWSSPSKTINKLIKPVYICMFPFCLVEQNKVARSVAVLIGMQSVLKSIPVSGTFLN